MSEHVRLWRYYLPAGPGEEWAEIVLTSVGMFAATSDWGNYAYAWRSFGECFRTFLTGTDSGYVMGKLSMRDEYQPDETLSAVKKAIIAMRRADEIDREKARECFDELANDYESLSDKYQFGRWYQDSIGAPEMGDAFEIAVFDYPRYVRAFCERILPRLAVVLRAELAAEKAAA